MLAHMVKVLDAAFPGWTVAELKAAGIVAVGRYLAPLPNGKVIKKPEYDALIAGGVGVFLVWEASATTALAAGYAGGYTHGREARRQARGLGHPDDRWIYQAVDTGAEPSAAIRSYQQGFNDGGNVDVQGVYGDVDIGHDLLDAHLVRAFWQTNARGWPGDRVDSPRAALIQRYREVVPGISGAYDVNDVIAADFGQNPKPVAPAPPTPVKPPTSTTTDHGDAPVKTTDIKPVHLDVKGDGNVPAPPGNIIGLLVVGGSDPNESKRYDARPAATLSADGKYIVLIGGVPSGTYTVRVTTV
jgi:hypothetical protein